MEQFATARELMQVRSREPAGESGAGEAEAGEFCGRVGIALELRSEDTAGCGECQKLSSRKCRGRNTRYFTSWLAA